MRFLGHPLHPPLVHLPFASWLLTPLADAAAFVTGDAFFARAALWLTGVGLAAALAAATAGLVDVATTKLDDASVRIVGAHATIMATATTLAGFGLLGRLNPAALPALDPWWPAAVGVATALLALAGAWFGGELVHGRGVGRRGG
jgi:uncharacterized membrane protein